MIVTRGRKHAAVEGKMKQGARGARREMVKTGRRGQEKQISNNKTISTRATHSVGEGVALPALRSFARP